MKSTHRYTALFAAAATSIVLAACGDRVDDTTVGQPMTPPATTVPSNSAEVRTDAPTTTNDMPAAGSQAAGNVADTASDMAITTKVNAALAADDQLSALKIDVDTEGGKVALSGTAPDEIARERATTLAAAVDGVVTVENRLTVVKDS